MVFIHFVDLSQVLTVHPAARPQVSPNDGFMKQLALFRRCNCDPSPNHPVYREFKEQLKAVIFISPLTVNSIQPTLAQDAIRFIKDFIDVYSYEEEKIFFCRSGLSLY
jgi:hypothetical protein